MGTINAKVASVLAAGETATTAQTGTTDATTDSGRAVERTDSEFADITSWLGSQVSTTATEINGQVSNWNLTVQTSTWDGAAKGRADAVATGVQSQLTRVTSAAVTAVEEFKTRTDADVGEIRTLITGHLNGLLQQYGAEYANLRAALDTYTGNFEDIDATTMNQGGDAIA